MLQPLSETRERTLRSSVNGTLSVPWSHTSLFDRSFSYLAPRLWNTIPIDIRNSSNLKSFKSNLKQALVCYCSY